MLRKIYSTLFLLIITGSNVFFNSSGSSAIKVEQIFRGKLKITIDRLDELKTAANTRQDALDIQQYFKQARLAYKQIEFLLEYYYPHLIRNINGPALPFSTGENSFAVLEPHGFQVMEEMIFPAYDSVNSGLLQQEIQILQQVLSGILYQQDPYGLQDKYILDAVRLEIYRVIALGITGYDSPVALYSLPEANAAITSLKEIVNIYLQEENDQSFARHFNRSFDDAGAYLLRHNDFNSFDRLNFITGYADQLSEKLLRLVKKLHFILPEERNLLSPQAPYLFASGFYNPDVYSPDEEANATPQKIALGEKLFYDTVLSINMQRSCATCHQREKAFTDGLPKSLALDNVATISRNAPTLWNAAFQPKQFYDSRAVFMEQQVFDVVHNAKEMGSSMQIVVMRLKQDSSYTKLFKDTYSYTGDPLNENNVSNAIASYLRSLVSLNSRFDQYMNGNKKMLNGDEKKGGNLFMGKAKCATCHFLPFFNGVAPPYFSEAESEVLGVPATKDTVYPKLDDDEGKYNLYPVSVFRFAFKTPTVRNIVLTGPYMHNGVFNTLEEVIDFYDKGGGTGLGIAPDNQTLPETLLQLSGKEKKELVAFLHTLTDTAGIDLHIYK